MKRFVCLKSGLFLAVLLIIPVAAALAAPPKVPITYPGDTDAAIARRAQWVEAARKEGTLTWWGTRRPEQGMNLIAEFNKIYPFIKVIYWRGRGEEVAVKFEAEHAAGRYDVDLIMGGEPYNYPRWRKMELIEKFIDFVPGIEKVQKLMYSKYGDWMQPGHSPKLPQYNTNMVSADEAPKNWDDLLDPRWKREICMQTDMNAWVILALAEGGWGVEKTEDFLSRIIKNKPRWTKSGSGGYALLMAGEFKVFVDSDMRNYMQLKEKGAPVEWVRADPIPTSGSSFILPKKSFHPNAARLFLEWVLSPPGLQQYEKFTRLGSAAPESGTRMGKALKGQNIVFRTEDVVLKEVELDLSTRFGQILGLISK